MNYIPLRQFEFGLAYLILLTRAGLKPLSRWEKAIPDGVEAVMDDLGLEIAHVCRRLQNGCTTTEFIFSHSEAYLELYLERFEGKHIEKSVANRRFEGFLFGFPSCCVESFARHGYLANDLEAQDQRILFHWACRHCTITPQLVPAYRQVYQQCQELFSNPERQYKTNAEHKKTVTKVLAVTTSLALAVTGMAMLLPAKAQSAQPPDDDPHWLPLDKTDDGDQDFIRDNDEPFLGLQPDNPDTDGDGQLDGPQLARALHLFYQSLPHSEQKAQPYVIDHAQRGVEQCPVCTSNVNMGYVEIVNPLEKITIEIPYIGLHYLEHGGFQYAGSVHTSGAVSPRKLDAVLKGDGTRHCIGLDPGVDGDQDGLYDKDEPQLGTNPDVADTDHDGMIDGTQLSRAFAALIDSLPSQPQKNLPYREEHMQKGIESCDHCGEWINMGFVRIINPVENQFVEVPYVALHYLRCGGFVYQGSVNKGVVNAITIQQILDFNGFVHRLPIQNDADNDGLDDAIEARFNCSTGKPDSDADGLADGMQLACQYRGEIENLPLDQGINTYRVDYLMDGLETCAACGELVNMGYLEIVNLPEQFRLQVPYIALHYLKHGSFAYHGDVHPAAQLDARTLDFALHSDGRMHLQPISGDNDQDGLTADEEVFWGTQPDRPDSDGDGVYDGVQVARQLAAKLADLPRSVQTDQPYLLEHLTWGLETCEVCGLVCNMGFMEIVNPVTGDSLTAPLVALHTMQHGSFSYDASIHEGRVDPIRLANVLTIDPTAVPDAPAQPPDQFWLYPNYPNPFNHSTTIRFDLPNAATVNVSIYNLRGQKVRTLLAETRPAGSHRITWDGKGEDAAVVAGGTFICVVKCGAEKRTIKLVFTP